jgi:hypothetical protein
MAMTTANCKGWVPTARQRGRWMGLPEPTEKCGYDAGNQNKPAARCECVRSCPVPGHGRRKLEVMRAGARLRALRSNAPAQPTGTNREAVCGGSAAAPCWAALTAPCPTGACWLELRQRRYEAARRVALQRAETSEPNCAHQGK